MNSFCPDWTSAPGETLSETLRRRGIAPSELGRRIQCTDEMVRAVLDGVASVTPELAELLEHALGVSATFWLSREADYRTNLTRLQEEATRAVSEGWLNQFPMADMVRYGWLKPASTRRDKAASCLQFFGVNSLEAWRASYEHIVRLAAFRTSPSFESDPHSVAAWLRQGEREAYKLPCRLWDKKRFVHALRDIRALTRQKDPRSFFPRVQQIAANAGVAIVHVRTPKKCHASGATRFLGPTKAVMLLSFRHRSDDQFWFTLFHEAAHLLLHGERSVFLEGLAQNDTDEEREADRFSSEWLIPGEYRQQMLDLPPKWQAVTRFATKIGIAPGIVVGQLQHEGRLEHNQLNYLKRRYHWTD